MDAAKWIDSTFRTMGWRDLAIGFALVFACFVALAAFAGEPYRKKAELQQKIAIEQNPHVVRRTMTSDTDPKSYVPVPDSAAAGDPFVIGWVVGSGANIKGAPRKWRYRGNRNYRLPSVLADYIKTAEGRPVRIDYLVQGASGILDIRRNLLYGLTDPDIDAVIVTINDYLAFNDWRVVSRPDRSAILDVPLADLVDWQALLTTAAPSDVFVRLLLKAIGIYDVRLELSEIYRSLDASRFLAGKGGAGRTPDPIRDWHTLLFPNSGSDRRAWLEMSTISEDGFAARVVAANIRAATQSGKPVVFYASPVLDDVATDPKSRQYLDEEMRLIDDFAARYGGENVHVVSWSAVSAPQPYAHRDTYHLQHGQGVVDMLVDQLRNAGLTIELNDIRNIYGPRSKNKGS